MKQQIDYEGYDTLLMADDWRGAAAVLGMVKYLEFSQGNYQPLDYKIISDLRKNGKPVPEQAIDGLDGIIYHSADITEERYLDFVEYTFQSEMTHQKILAILDKDSLTDEDIKDVNTLAKSKTVLKNILGKVKFDGTNSDVYKQLIRDNQRKIVKEIYRYSPMMYRGFNNTNLLLTEENPHCRLQGYTVDEGRKTRYIGYGFDKDTFVGQDYIEMDFIPFAFTDTYESYFINNNFDVHTLEQTNQSFIKAMNEIEEKNPRTRLYLALKNSSGYIKYDVEIIIKPRDAEYYQTLFVRAERLKALQEIGGKLKFNYKISDSYYFNLENEVYERCLNNQLLDSCIEFLLKIGIGDTEQARTARIRTNQLVELNEKWRGVLEMSKLKQAIAEGHKASEWFLEHASVNKLGSFKQKLIGAVVAHDYNRMNEILLNLSAYIDTELSFAYALFENPEENIGLAYAFANALTPDVKNFKTDKENV